MKPSKLLTWVKTITIVAVSLESQWVYSQNLDPSSTFIFLHKIKAQGVSFGTDLSSIQGSPYINKEFVKSKIINLKNDSVSIPLRYNPFQDEMEYQQDKQLYWLDKLSIKIILMGTDIYIPVSYPDGNSVVTSYFLAISTGKYSLLKKTKMLYREAETATGYNEPKPNRFERDEDKFFIKFNDHDLVLIQSKKDFLNGFPSLSDKLNAYLKKNKPRFNSENDLIALVNYMNSSLE